jgi:thioester reductase-like protein
MDPEVWEVILAEELEHDLHPTDGWDLSAELDKAHVRVDRIDGGCATEAEQLSQWVMRISNVLVNLGLLPIQDTPQLPKSAQKVMSAVDLVMKHLQEALASDIDPWD